MIMIPQSGLEANEILSQKLTQVDRDASVLDASKLMRKSGTSELLVTGKIDGMLRPFGIVTANDIVTRVIATELNPAVLTMGDIAWSCPDGTQSASRDNSNQHGACETNADARAIMDRDGRLIGTLRLDEIWGDKQMLAG